MHPKDIFLDVRGQLRRPVACDSIWVVYLKDVDITDRCFDRNTCNTIFLVQRKQFAYSPISRFSVWYQYQNSRVYTLVKYNGSTRTKCLTFSQVNWDALEKQIYLLWIATKLTSNDFTIHILVPSIAYTINFTLNRIKKKTSNHSN